MHCFWVIQEKPESKCTMLWNEHRNVDFLGTEDLIGDQTMFLKK